MSKNGAAPASSCSSNVTRPHSVPSALDLSSSSGGITKTVEVVEVDSYVLPTVPPEATEVGTVPSQFDALFSELESDSTWIASRPHVRGYFCSRILPVSSAESSTPDQPLPSQRFIEVSIKDDLATWASLRGWLDHQEGAAVLRLNALDKMLTQLSETYRPTQHAWGRRNSLEDLGRYVVDKRMARETLTDEHIELVLESVGYDRKTARGM